MIRCVNDPDSRQAELVEGWERSAAGWGRQADRFRAVAMPVSTWMIEHLALTPGQRVLELAAGPGDTGFLAAAAVGPGGTLVCSDGAEAMLKVARARATKLGIENVEFLRLELEWIDLSTANVDAILCRWGFMLSADPEAAVQEARRVLRPGGRIALAVWDEAERNPWATVPRQALLTLGHTSPADPSGPGMFALSAPGRLHELLAGAGFLDVLVEGVELDREYPSLEDYLEETRDLARSFAEACQGLSDQQRAGVRRTIASLAEPFTAADGSLRLPGRSLVAIASA